MTIYNLGCFLLKTGSITASPIGCVIMFIRTAFRVCYIHIVAEITHLFSGRHTFFFCWYMHPCTSNQDYTKVNVIFSVILEKPIRIPRSLSVKAASILKGFLNKVSLTLVLLNCLYCILTLVLLNCLYCIFRHLKLELLTQFPASNDEKYLYFLKIDIF